RVLVEDVHGAVADLVDLIKTYQNKGNLSQVIILMSTFFQRRQEEMEAVIDKAMSYFNWGLHVKLG
ncbi:unnamed protein product, partial [Ectocarpus sp. 4 AP-2014]